MEDPLNRLAAAIVGTDDAPAVIALANSVLSSQIGANSQDYDGNDIDLSSIWRRISRKAPNHKSAKDEVQRLYRLVERETTEDPDLPAKMLVVLTKLMGKRIPTVDIKAHSRREAAKQNNISRDQGESSLSVKSTADLPRRFSPLRKKQISQGQDSTQHKSSPLAGRQSALYAHVEENPSSPHQHLQRQCPDKKPHHKQPRASHDNAASLLSPLLSRRAAINATSRNNFTLNEKTSNVKVTEEEIEQLKRELQEEEDALLKECLYSLQGIDGERIRFYHRDPGDTRLPTISDYEGIRVQSPALAQNLYYSGRFLETRLGSGATDALRICGEVGWLYKRIQSYIRLVQSDETKGVVARAFAESLAEQLRDYHSLLTTYESKLPEFSLRQFMLELWTPTNRLKTLAMLTDGLKQYTGGHLLSALYKHSIHGNTEHTNLVRSILYKASKPWFEILYTWTTQGVLSDPWQEFFVIGNGDVDNKFLWAEKYQLNQDRVPIGIIDQELVMPAFTVGKGINFIRHCLLDGLWTMDVSGEDFASSAFDNQALGDTTALGGLSKVHSIEDLGYCFPSHGNSTFEEGKLQKTLTAAARHVQGHILLTLKEENHLLDHLFAMKQFLLLGQGDFFSALFEGLHNEFRRDDGESGVAGVYKHSLLSIVEGALRTTNAKYLPQYTIDCLQVELLLGPGEDVESVKGKDRLLQNNKSSADHRTVYDIFMLDYQVPDPISAVVPSKAVKLYKMTFVLLFRLRKIEYILNLTWRQSATLSHALQTSAQYTGTDQSTNAGYSQAIFLLRTTSILRQSMTHLVVNLKSYFMFEVIEGEWRKLVMFLNEAANLDEAIAAHECYLGGIVRKSMIRNEEVDDYTQDCLSDQIDIVLSIVDEFCSFQGLTFNRALRAADVAAEKRVEAESRLKRGEWGFESEKENLEQETFFGLADTLILEHVKRMSIAYNDHALVLLDALSDKVNGSVSDFAKNDANLVNANPYITTTIHEEEGSGLDPQRFLIAQLDYNNFYANQLRGA